MPNAQTSSPPKFDRFLQRLDQDPQLKTCRVVYFDGDLMTVVRKGPPVSGAGTLAVVIKPDLGPEVQTSANGAKARESKLYAELLNGALGCSSAAIGWVVATTSAAAAPVTGGTSLFLTMLSGAGALASGAQCLNSSVRIYNELTDPEANDRFDSMPWYKATEKALDALSVAGAVGSGAGVVRLVMRMRKVTGKSMIEILKGLNRQERRRLAEELLREQNPGISNKQLKMLLRTGQYPVRFSGLQVTAAMNQTLLEAAGTLLDVGGSSRDGVVGDAVGLVVGVARSVETQ